MVLRTEGATCTEDHIQDKPELYRSLGVISKPLGDGNKTEVMSMAASKICHRLGIARSVLLDLGHGVVG